MAICFWIVTSLELVSSVRCFDGTQRVYQHASATLSCDMRFGVYLPPSANVERVPALFWLSGLTGTEQNFIMKAGAQRVASALGVALVVSDTSPRGAGVPDDESYDFGCGAGFYVDATRAPWSTHYRMYSYKGIAGVPRASIVVVAATLPLFGIPAEGIALLLAADTFIDMGRTVTNVVGNSVAAAVIAKFEARRARTKEDAIGDSHGKRATATEVATDAERTA